MTDTVKTQLTPLASHFKRVAEFYQGEAQMLAVALEAEMSAPKIPLPLVTVPETSPNEGEK